MKLTKFGHCCLLIEENGVRILTDPGAYSDSQNFVQNINVVLITHEHSDHIHIDSLKAIIKSSPNLKIFTNTGVGALLAKEGIGLELLEVGASHTEQGVLIEAIGKYHALIHDSIPTIPNTGFFIANRLFYPGDALTKPNKPVEIFCCSLPISHLPLL